MPSEARRLCEIGGVVDLADLMMPVSFVADKARGDVGGRAAGMAGPAGQRLAEIDIEHDAAEIEQQRVGGSGGEAGVISVVYKMRPA